MALHILSGINSTHFRVRKVFAYRPVFINKLVNELHRSPFTILWGGSTTNGARISSHGASSTGFGYR